MKRLHVLIVSRRYWPHCDDSVLRLMALAEGLRRAGVVVTVMSPRHASDWPTEIDHRETVVLRPLSAPRGDWSIGRYSRNLSKWLRENGSRFDLIYCDNMREEAAAVVETAKKLGVSTVTRCGSCLGESDLVWRETSRAAKRTFDKTFQSDTLIAANASTQQALLAAGAVAHSIVRISDGVGSQIQRTDQLQQQARLSLADINSDLYVPQNGTVLLCTNRLSPGGGALHLAQSLEPLIVDRPDTRLWLIGDGPWRPKIYNELKHMSLNGAVLLPGSFDHLDELFVAADLFVLPSAADGLQYSWPTAIAAGLPAAVVDCAETRAFAGTHQSEMYTFKNNDPVSLRSAVAEILDDIQSANLSAGRIRTALSAQNSFASTVDSHVGLMENLVRKATSRSVTGALG